MGRQSDRTRRRSSHSSRSRRSVSRSDASQSFSEADSDTPSGSPSPNHLDTRKRRLVPRIHRKSDASSRKRSRIRESEPQESDSEVEQEHVIPKGRRNGRRSAIAEGEKYKKVNGKWFSREEYEVLVKAGLSEDGAVLNSPHNTSVAEPQQDAKAIGVGFELDLGHDEEDRNDLEAEADELLRSLRAPLKGFEKQAISSFKAAIEEGGVKFDAGLKSLDGQAIKDHLVLWQQEMVQKRDEAIAGWQAAAASVNSHREQTTDAIKTLRKKHGEHRSALEETKEKWTKTVRKQQAELEEIQSSIQEMQEKYTTKMETATDKKKIQNEVDRRMTQVLQNSA